MRHPKPRRLTDEQEAELWRTETLMTRARIMERGCAAILNNGEYAASDEIAECAAVLTEAVNLRIECETRRAAISKTELEAYPHPPKRYKGKVTVRPNPARRLA